MTTTIRRSRQERNKIYVDQMKESVESIMARWLNGRLPTGKMTVMFEVNASQGGIGDVSIEENRKEKIV